MPVKGRFRPAMVKKPCLRAERLSCRIVLRKGSLVNDSDDAWVIVLNTSTEHVVLFSLSAIDTLFPRCCSSHLVLRLRKRPVHL